jgi:hypothetical protein
MLALPAPSPQPGVQKSLDAKGSRTSVNRISSKKEFRISSSSKKKKYNRN